MITSENAEDAKKVQASSDYIKRVHDQYACMKMRTNVISEFDKLLPTIKGRTFYMVHIYQV